MRSELLHRRRESHVLREGVRRVRKGSRVDGAFAGRVSGTRPRHDPKLAAHALHRGEPDPEHLAGLTLADAKESGNGFGVQDEGALARSAAVGGLALLAAGEDLGLGLGRGLRVHAVEGRVVHVHVHGGHFKWKV
eukprot:1009991-Rhodomonas_salina.1